MRRINHQRKSLRLLNICSVEIWTMMKKKKKRDYRCCEHSVLNNWEAAFIFITPTCITRYFSRKWTGTSIQIFICIQEAGPPTELHEQECDGHKINLYAQLQLVTTKEIWLTMTAISVLHDRGFWSGWCLKPRQRKQIVPVPWLTEHRIRIKEQRQRSSSFTTCKSTNWKEITQSK